MEVERDKMRLTVSYRGKNYTAEVPIDATVGLLGKELSQLTGVDVHTMRLLVPKGRGVPAAPLLPATEPYSFQSIKSSGISPGVVLRMMGATSKEIQEVNQPIKDDRVLGFEEELRRLQRHPLGMTQRVLMPKGPYTFHDFRPLEVPFLDLNPPADKARDIMIKLALDSGIVAIMNKHKWKVGVMTELAPDGFVGVSPKCILGFNKNRGEEISLRLRTDDLQGFRKYASIKKTLLHELAHMVHDEHDEKFHALDKQLNQEAIDLDWTKGRGVFLNKNTRPATSDEDHHEHLDATGYKVANVYTVREPLPPSATRRNAAAQAALKRLAINRLASKKMNEPDPDESSDETVASTEGPEAGMERDNKKGRTEPDPDEALQHSAEPDPDESTSRASVHPVSVHQDLNTSGGFQEPDPDDMLMKKEDDPVPGKSMDFIEPDPDESTLLREEPDPDKSMHFKEPDPDESMHFKEPDPDESMHSEEPDPDESVKAHEPDPDESVKAHEPDPDENRHDLGVPNGEIGRIQDATSAVIERLQRAIVSLRQKATPAEATSSIATLSTILSNRMNYPNNDKFKVLRKGNSRFHNQLGRFEAAVEFLRVVGFSDEVVGGDSSLVSKSSDPGLLWLALSVLDNAVAV